jgi:hypothetical protein
VKNSLKRVVDLLEIMTAGSDKTKISQLKSISDVAGRLQHDLRRRYKSTSTSAFVEIIIDPEFITEQAKIIPGLLSSDFQTLFKQSELNHEQAIARGIERSEELARSIRDSGSDNKSREQAYWSARRQELRDVLRRSVQQQELLAGGDYTSGQDDSFIKEDYLFQSYMRIAKEYVATECDAPDKDR